MWWLVCSAMAGQLIRETWTLSDAGHVLVGRVESVDDYTVQLDVTAVYGTEHALGPVEVRLDRPVEWTNPRKSVSERVLAGAVMPSAGQTVAIVTRRGEIEALPHDAELERVLELLFEDGLAKLTDAELETALQQTHLRDRALAALSKRGPVSPVALATAGRRAVWEHLRTASDDDARAWLEAASAVPDEHVTLVADAGLAVVKRVGPRVLGPVLARLDPSDTDGLRVLRDASYQLRSSLEADPTVAPALADWAVRYVPHRPSHRSSDGVVSTIAKNLTGTAGVRFVAGLAPHVHEGTYVDGGIDSYVFRLIETVVLADPRPEHAAVLDAIDPMRVTTDYSKRKKLEPRLQALRDAVSR